MALNRIAGYVTVLIIVLMAGILPVQSAEKKPQPTDKVATVNGTPIERSEFEGEVLTIQKNLLSIGRPLTCNQLTAIQSEVLESMIRRELLYQESRKAGIKPDADAVSAEIIRLKQQFPNETEYNNELSRRNISEEVLRSRMERNSTIQQYVERQFAAKVSVTDSEMISLYESRLDLFKQPLQACASHILIKTEPTWADSRKQEARRKAEQIVKNVKQKQDFAVLAREHSDGSTRTSGGDLGCIKTGQIEKQLERVVFSLKPGETSDIIETEHGFHMFKVTDKKPETVLAYDSVKDKIRQFLLSEKAKQEAELRAKVLRETADVKILLNEDLKQADKKL